MEKSGHEQPQPLHCPRCKSTNTKFCYYNNYSLAQPRHFCKACKRYWTRGGTLRNVPVGGGCRKNKRMMRRHAVEPATATTSFNFTAGDDGISAPAFSVTTNNNSLVQSSDLDLCQSSNAGSNSSSFYPNPREIKFPFSMFSSLRVSSELGLSSGIGSGDAFQQTNYENGVDQIQNFANSNSNSGSIPSCAARNVNPVHSFRSSFPSSTMTSLPASTFQQQNFLSCDDLKHVHHGHNLRNLIPSEDVAIMQPGKHVDSTIEQMNNTSPHVLWNASGEWFDPSDLGSSVPSLI